MKKLMSTALILVLVFAAAACDKGKTGTMESGIPDMSESSELGDAENLNFVTFPAYKEENPQNLPYIEQINQTPKFQASVDLPENWIIQNAKPGGEINVPGDFYTPLPIYDGDNPIGYIGFNIFEPYADEIPQEEYYKTVYPSLRLPSIFHWDPYTPIKTSGTAETGIADIWYLDPEEIDRHPGAMPSVPQLETIGILSYDKELKVFIGMAFLPDTVTRQQAELIGQSVHLSPAD